MKFNFNDVILVKLTDHGRSICSEQGIRVTAEDDRGRTRWQIWELWQELGKYAYFGSPVQPFEMEFEFEERPRD